MGDDRSAADVFGTLKIQRPYCFDVASGVVVPFAKLAQRIADKCTELGGRGQSSAKLSASGFSSPLSQNAMVESDHKRQTDDTQRAQSL